MKLCIECKHCIKTLVDMESGKTITLTNPQCNLTETTDPVFGHKSYLLCRSNRERDINGCGAEGKNWEPIPSS